MQQQSPTTSIASSHDQTLEVAAEAVTSVFGQLAITDPDTFRALQLTEVEVLAGLAHSIGDTSAAAQMIYAWATEDTDWLRDPAQRERVTQWLDLAPELLDQSSTASRKHYLATGLYLPISPAATTIDPGLKNPPIAEIDHAMVPVLHELKARGASAFPTIFKNHGLRIDIGPEHYPVAQAYIDPADPQLLWRFSSIDGLRTSVDQRLTIHSATDAVATWILDRTDAYKGSTSSSPNVAPPQQLRAPARPRPARDLSQAIPDHHWAPPTPL